MAEQTGISWCDATWNPWWGCEKVSPACAHCYAERDSNRYGFQLWGSGHDFRFLSDANWRKPLLWAARARKGQLPDGKPNRDGHRPRVFTASMADVFEERAEVEADRRRLFDLIAETPELDWLVLTKRPRFARAWLYDFYARGGMRAWSSRDGLGWAVLPNVWLGVSIENAAYTWRADVLREIPAPIRFLSCEPLLGNLFPENVTTGTIPGAEATSETRRAPGSKSSEPRAVLDRESRESGPGVALRRAPLDLTGIDWVIIGGESGSRAKARPMHPAWARRLRDEVQRHEANGGDRIALHMKQWGSWTPDPHGRDPHAVWILPNGSRISRFDADTFRPDLADAARMSYAGPQPGAGGKFLDGTDLCAFPPSPEALLTLA